MIVIKSTRKFYAFSHSPRLCLLVLSLLTHTAGYVRQAAYATLNSSMASGNWHRLIYSAVVGIKVGRHENSLGDMS
jgi:hypothetical protein